MTQVAKKLAVLETEVERLKELTTIPRRSGQWYVENAGHFKDDPVYDEIVRRGRAYRASLRPKTRGKKKR